MDHADKETKVVLLDAIRPLLPAIRQTPHGRRIQSKMMDGRASGTSSGHITPQNTAAPGQLPLGNPVTAGPSHQHAGPAPAGFTNPAAGNYGGPNGYSAPIVSPQPYRNNNGPLNQLQAAVNQAFPPYGRPQQPNGVNYR